MTESPFSLSCFEDLTKGWHVKFRSYWAGSWGGAGLLVTSSVVLARGFLTLVFPHSLLETPGSWEEETWHFLPGGCRALQPSGGTWGKTDVLMRQKSFFLIPQLSILTWWREQVIAEVSASFSGEQLHINSWGFPLSFLNKSMCCPLFLRRG